MPRPINRNTPSTNLILSMISLILPPQDRRNFLRSFWFVVSFIFAAGLCLVAAWIQAPFPLVIGLLAGTSCGLLVFAKEQLVRRLYHAWNRRIIRPFANLASRAIMAICFFIILVATGRTRPRSRFGGHGATGWQRRSSLPDLAYAFPYVSEQESTPGIGWFREYLRWAIRSGNTWSITLLPFLWFLRLLSYEEKRSFAANIYTLF
jgi:hypothetical protein